MLSWLHVENVIVNVSKAFFVHDDCTKFWNGTRLRTLQNDENLNWEKQEIKPISI